VSLGELWTLSLEENLTLHNIKDPSRYNPSKPLKGDTQTQGFVSHLLETWEIDQAVDFGKALQLCGYQKTAINIFLKSWHKQAHQTGVRAIEEDRFARINQDFFKKDGDKFKFLGFHEGAPIAQVNIDKLIEDFKTAERLKAVRVDDVKEEDQVIAEDGKIPAGTTQAAGAVAGEPRAEVEKKKKEEETKSKENATLLWFGGIAIAAMVFFGYR